MITINIYEAKANFSALINKVETTHEKIIILKRGKPVAKLIPIDKKHERLAVHPEISNIKINYDPTESTEKEWENVVT
jgi:prevent-host-death family protein